MSTRFNVSRSNVSLGTLFDFSGFSFFTEKNAIVFAFKHFLDTKFENVVGIRRKDNSINYSAC